MDNRLNQNTAEKALRREAWRARREAMEAAPSGRRWRGRVRHYIHGTAAVTNRLLGRTEVFRRIAARAIDLGLTEVSFSFPDLPPAFEGYRILHLTDLHLDNIDETAARTLERIAGIEANLCVITGDIRDNIHAPLRPVFERLEHVLSGVRAADGVFGILGNHDSAAMVEPMEALGVKMLINESVTVRRGPDEIHVTGLDDVHLFPTKAALRALRATPDGFGITLVHSPEVAHRASARHRLYLCGHTHGGGFGIPGRRPIITGLKRNRHMVRGVWQHEDMIGYTSRGIGASLLPTRFRSSGEVGLITLRRGPQGARINGFPA